MGDVLGCVTLFVRWVGNYGRCVSLPRGRFCHSRTYGRPTEVEASHHKMPDQMPGPPEKVTTLPTSEAQQVRFLPRSFAMGSLRSGIDRTGDCNAFAVYSGRVGVFMPDGQGLCRKIDGSAMARSEMTHVAASARYDLALEPRNSRTFCCRDKSTDERPRLRPLEGISRSGRSRCLIGRVVGASESDSFSSSKSGEDIGSATRGLIVYDPK
jgi:hypothetical protein